MKVLGIVPARGGSKRMPGKNLRILAGRPLVAFALEAALSARRVDTVLLSSDDQEILDVGGSYAGVRCLRRPPELATDTSPALEYVRHALSTMAEEGVHFDAIAILQPTSPLTLPADIDATLELLELSGADSAVSVMKVNHAYHPVKFKTMTGNRLFDFLAPEEGLPMAHELPDIYVRNGSVYASARAQVDRGPLLGSDCRGYLMPSDRSVDINEEIDLLLARLLLERGASTR